MPESLLLPQVQELKRLVELIRSNSYFQTHLEYRAHDTPVMHLARIAERDATSGIYRVLASEIYAGLRRTIATIHSLMWTLPPLPEGGDRYEATCEFLRENLSRVEPQAERQSTFDTVWQLGFFMDGYLVPLGAFDMP